jgi:hypothetical protein
MGCQLSDGVNGHPACNLLRQGDTTLLSEQSMSCTSILQGKELAQLRRTIAALSTPPRPQKPQQHQPQGRPQQPPEWAELYDLYSSPDGGSSGSGQSGEQLGVFEHGRQRQVAMTHFHLSDCCTLKHRLLIQHSSSCMYAWPCMQETQQYTVEEPPSPCAPDAHPAARARQPVPQRPREGCLVEIALLSSLFAPVAGT